MTSDNTRHFQPSINLIISLFVIQKLRTYSFNLIYVNVINLFVHSYYVHIKYIEYFYF